MICAARRDSRRRLDQIYRTIRNMIPHYIVRHLAGEFEELSCFLQLEDESAALYFNIVHGAKARRRFTTRLRPTPARECDSPRADQERRARPTALRSPSLARSRSLSVSFDVTGIVLRQSCTTGATSAFQAKSRTPSANSGAAVPSRRHPSTMRPQGRQELESGLDYLR